MQLKKMQNWKEPGLAGIQGFWLKRFTSQHQRLTEKLNENIQSLSIPSWLVKSRTVLTLKDSVKGNAVGNYQQMAYLNILWKLKTGIIANNLYNELLIMNYFCGMVDRRSSVFIVNFEHISHLVLVFLLLTLSW